jgi:hypothetical protein
MSLVHEEYVNVSRHGLSRRGFLRNASGAAAVAGTLGFHDLMGLQAAELKKRGRSMILLWMQGAPSQFETFDPKPGTESSGPTKAIDTSVSGIRIAQGWDKTAQVMDDIALIRSMTNREGNHQRATYQMHTGYIPSGSVKHPSLAANIAKEIGDEAAELPHVVSVGQTVGAGFLGVDYDPFVVANPGQLPQNVESVVSTPRFNRRLGLLNRLEADFAARGGKVAVENHRKLYGKTSKLVQSSAVKAFDISDESAETKARYGDTNFGRGCLLARRLVESGVTFTEVRLGNWDTHFDNFERTETLIGQADPAVAALISDLKQRGLLEKTLVVWMGEFGRTPRINPRTGRDHYPRVFNAAIAGGGVKGGQVIGASTANGAAVKNDPVTVPDLFCSICKSLEIDPRVETISPLGRPMKIVDGGKVVDQLFG